MKIGSLIIALLLSVCAVSFIFIKQEKKPYERPTGFVSVVCNGQLGNQLFKIASILSYAWQYDLVPIFPSLNNPGDNLTYNRDHYFTSLDKREFPVPLSTYRLPVLNYISLPPMGNVVMEGGFFSYKYFHRDRERLLNIFAQPKVVEKLKAKYPELFAHPKTVSVHVRTYSKITHDTGLHFLGLDYFAQAIEQFPRDSLFVVFTDRTHWTRHHFKLRFPDTAFVFIEGNDHIEDLVLMSQMKHNIISNSTYSWWGAYLNENPDKIVYHPLIQRTWVSRIKDVLRPVVNVFRKNPPLVFHDEDYYLPEWKAIYYTVKDYPNDINAFGDESKSVFKDDK